MSPGAIFFPAPTRAITNKKRPFESVVTDLKCATFAVVRGRNSGAEGVKWTALGSGFFISPTHFFTCHHVINPVQLPHQAGDIYWLIRNRGNGQCDILAIDNLTIGTNFFLEPTKDAAIVVVSDLAEIQRKQRSTQLYARPSFGPILDGEEIGVMGYPLAQIAFRDRDVNKPVLNTFVTRTSKGIVTSQQRGSIQTVDGYKIHDINLIEVTFLFVPGNSGGPVFNAKTGEVVGFVHGFNSVTLSEQVRTAKINPPDGVSKQYIDTQKMVYSIAISFTSIREFLKKHGAA